EKLWDGIGNVVIPPQPHTGIDLELAESVPMIMEHPDHYLLERFPENNELIDGSGVKVCIIDTGIDRFHPDLRDRIVFIKDFTKDNDGVDYIGHGTHVAGIVAGNGTASHGSSKGVAPGADLYVAKVFSGNGGGAELTNILDAIEWAVDNKMDVVNMSLGSELPGCDGTCHLCRAADWAAENEVTVMLSAGNSGSRKGTITCPANSKYSLAVGALDKVHKIAEFSSRGPTLDGRPKPDIVTPGVSIKAARASNTSMGKPVDQYYTIASGTSMAAPHGSGVASLLIQIYRHYSKKQFGHEIQLSSKDIKNIMMQGTIDIDTDANVAGEA
uniref:S8 family peptidase n=1 Tax=uncultured Methanomethylovorans sp. TaxID=183759 RepID=UPI002AA69199